MKVKERLERLDECYAHARTAIRNYNEKDHHAFQMLRLETLIMMAGDVMIAKAYEITGPFEEVERDE